MLTSTSRRPSLCLFCSFASSPRSITPPLHLLPYISSTQIAYRSTAGRRSREHTGKGGDGYRGASRNVGFSFDFDASQKLMLYCTGTGLLRSRRPIDRSPDNFEISEQGRQLSLSRQDCDISSTHRCTADESPRPRSKTRSNWQTYDILRNGILQRESCSARSTYMSVQLTRERHITH